MTGIYKITNLINNKVYIGQSIHIERRLAEHKRRAFNPNDTGYNIILASAIRKYGIDNFKIEILEECDTTSLDEREIFWISKYNSSTKGYNTTPGGHLTHTTIPQEIATKVIRLLTDTTKGTREIAKECGITQGSVLNISQGRTWNQKDIEYPIRRPSTIKNLPDRFLFKKQIRENSIVNLKKIYNVSNGTIYRWCKTLGLPESKRIINSMSEEDWNKL